MSHLTPEEQSALDRLHAHKMQAQSSLSFWANAEANHGKDGKWIHPDDWEKQMANIHHLQSLAAANVDAFTLAADAIEQRAALRADNEALAGTVGEMRQVLILSHDFHLRLDSYHLEKGCKPNCLKCRRKAALALSLPQAARQVAEWKEKAELLDALVEGSGERGDMIRVKYYSPGSVNQHPNLEFIRQTVMRHRAAKEASDE